MATRSVSISCCTRCPINEVPQVPQVLEFGVLKPGGLVIRRLAFTLVVLGVAAAAPHAFAQGSSQPAAPPAAVEKNDYSKPDAWLCRPGLTEDACAVDLTTTVVKADGTMSSETWA